MWTLVVDCDPQANTTGGMGFLAIRRAGRFYHALMHDVSMKDVILNTGVEGLHLIPSEKNLVGAAVELVEQPEREQCCAKRWRRFASSLISFCSIARHHSTC